MTHHDMRLPAQKQAYVIEIDETPAGLVSRNVDERFFTFVSASSRFNALEGHRFATPVAAELAARQLLRRGRPQRLSS